jgi:hypothetical protein
VEIIKAYGVVCMTEVLKSKKPCLMLIMHIFKNYFSLIKQPTGGAPAIVINHFCILNIRGENLIFTLFYHDVAENNLALVSVILHSCHPEAK